MSDPFLHAAAGAPARHADERWRQVALLAVSAAAYGDERARPPMAAALLALDAPAEAGRIAAAAPPDDPWARWWAALAVGQAGALDDLDAAVAAACAAAEGGRGPEAREVARRLADLRAELAALAGDADADARFLVLGHRARPERRVLLGGRSSAAFLVDPRWDALRLVRLAPSEGPAAGNRAHLRLDEIQLAVRRGDAGLARDVPGDLPPNLDPEAMLVALREEPTARNRRLMDLAEEVRAERERLAGERVALEDERAAVRAERQRLRRLRPAPEPAPPSEPARLPRTPAEAAALLGVERGAPARAVEAAYREQVVRCHPDRVADLHPSIRERAQHLTVALNAARDLLLERGRPRRTASG